MADEEKDEGQQGGEPKLIAGKFKTVEEAEKALLEQDKLIGRQGTELGQLRKDVEDLRERTTSTAATRPAADPEIDEEAISRDLLANPGTFLREFGRSIYQATVKEAKEEARREVQMQRTVDRFLDKNPEVEKNVRLFNAYLANTDPKAGIEDRLRLAHDSLKADLADAAKVVNDKRSAESRSREKASTTAGAEGDGELEGAPAPESNETGDPMKSYLSERLNERSKRLL